MFPWAGCALTAPFHPYPAKSGAVSLCCTCPGVTPGGRYPLSLPCGARTFLIWVLSVPIRGCPPRSRIYCTSWGGKSQMSCKFFSERIYYIICLPVQLSITYTNWEFVEVSARPEQHCHSEPVRRLVWESPSNSGQPIVIQSVLFVPFPGIHPREVVRLTRGLPRQFENWLAMTGNSINSNLYIS